MTGRVLVTFGSKRGGTAGLASMIADTLREHGLDVDCTAVSEVRSVEAYDAVIVGGALYMMRWVREARRFVTRNAAALRRRPVWMFSSGPLDDSATELEIAPVAGVASLMAHVGARGHATFGGRLTADAHGVIAAAMARKLAGDWRDRAHVQRWARGIAADLAAAPRIDAPPARPVRWPLAAMSLLVGVSAILGGLGFASSPGILVLLVIGLGNTLAGALVLRDTHIANTTAFLGGTALLIWIGAEIVVLRTLHVLQFACLALAVAIMVEALRRRAAARNRTPTLRSAAA